VSTLPPLWTIGSWSASQGGLDDGQGANWLVNKDAGWFSPLGVRQLHIDRYHDHGVLRGRNYRPPRVVTLIGVCSAASPAAMGAALDRFNALLSDGGLSQLLVTEPAGGQRSAMVEITDASQAEPFNSTEFDFQLVLTAQDPRKYAAQQSATTGLPAASGGLDWVTGGGLNWVTGGGLNWGTVTSSGSLVMTNSGTAETWPTFVIRAGANALTTPGITITVSGATLFYNGTLQVADELTIVTNPIGRSVLLNGAADRRNLLTTAQWSPIAPGASVSVAFSAASYTSTASLEARWSPAFW